MIEENFKNTDAKYTTDYLNSFIRNTENQQNKFKRFIKQLKLEMFDFIKKNILYDDFYKDFQVRNIEDYIYNGLLIYFDFKSNENLYMKNEEFNLTEKDIEDNKIMKAIQQLDPNFFLSILNFVYPYEFTFTDTNYLFQQLLLNYEEFRKIEEKTFEIISIEYIAYMMNKNENANEFNYINEIMPKDDDTWYKLINDIYVTICYKFELFLITNDEKYQKSTEEKNLEKKNDELLTIIEKLEKENEEKISSIEKLKKLLEQEKEAKYKYVKIETESYKQDIANLNKKIKQLEIENNILKNKEKNKEIIEKTTPVENIKKNIDFDQLKLLFVSSDSSTFKNDFKNSFKNCKVVYDNFKIDFSKYDYVIVITSHIDHSTYNTMKDHCKTVGVPFLHCSSTNVERIKELIYEKEIKK